VIDANQAGNTNWSAAPQAQQSFTVASGATKLVLTATNSNPAAGAGDSLTITAKNGSNATVTAYTGDKTLTFGGASNSPNGTVPTVADKSGTAVNFGTAETITFSNGVATATGSRNGVMTLYKAGSANITVSDGTINNSASPLAMFVNSAGVALSYSIGCPSATMTKNTSALVSIIFPNDSFGNAFTTQSNAAFGLALNNTTSFGFGTVGTGTTTVSVTTGGANSFSIAESGGGKSTNLTMPTVPAGFTAAAPCTVTAN
jgi:hypothetical protein